MASDKALTEDELSAIVARFPVQPFRRVWIWSAIPREVGGWHNSGIVAMHPDTWAEVEELLRSEMVKVGKVGPVDSYCGVLVEKVDGVMIREAEAIKWFMASLPKLADA